MSKEAESFIKDLAETDISGADAIAVYYMAHAWLHKARAINDAINASKEAATDDFISRPLSI